MSLDEKWSLLSDYVHKAIKKLEKRDVTHAEAFFTCTRTIEVMIRNSEILTQNSAEDAGVGFRVAVTGDQVGFACTNTLDEKSVSEVGEKALSIAKVSSNVPDFALPRASSVKRLDGLFDSRIAEARMEEVVDIAKRAINSAEGFDNRVIAKDGQVSYMSGWRGVANTVGIDFEEQETKASVLLVGSGKQDGEVTGSCYDHMLRRTADLNPESIGERVGKMVVASFKPQILPTFQGTVVFGPQAVSYQLCDVLADALKGENIVTKRSAWTERVGQEVVSEKIMVVDNALLKDGFASRSFDDEGCPSHNTVLIAKGELKGFLHHATSANALNTENTGNASRFPGGLDMVRMIVGNGYRAKPEVYPSNLVIQAGLETRSELLSEVDEGVLIESMAGFAQEGSGAISAQLSRAFYVDDGEVRYPIKGGMVSGVAFDWFKQVSGVGNDSKQFLNSRVPSLRVENVKVIGT